MPAYDQTALFVSGKKFDGLAELVSFESQRRETLVLLESLPDSVLVRTARHEKLGLIGFGELLNEFVFHDLGHIRQVIELYRSRVFYPKMGAFQTYYSIHP